MMCRKILAGWMKQNNWRKNKLAHSFALLSVVALAATGTFAVEDSAKISALGLSGIFPATPPADLSGEEFAKLDGNWADWSKSAYAVVADFYAKIDSTDATAQRNALGNLKVKLDVIHRALGDSRYRSLHGPLTSLHNSLALRIDLAEATLDTLDFDGQKMAASKSANRASELLTAINALEADLTKIPNGLLWLPYFKVDAVKTALVADAQGAAAAATQSASLMQSRDYVLDGAQKEFTHRSSFETYASALNGYLQSAKWNNTAEAASKLRAEFKALTLAIDTFATSGEKAGELRHAFARVRFAAPDGGDRIASTLQTQLFNYNLRMLVSEDFLNRLMSQNRCETGPVVDCILGASVSGCQITNTSVNVDLKPSNTTARFDLRLQGTIQSNTQGVTPQATVYTLGNHVFTATKEVNFDGNKFWTSPASIAVSPHNTTTGVATKFSRIPLLGNIADNIASGQVEAKRGEAESIAASRVQDGVLPRFNSEVNASFANAGQKLNSELYEGLRASKLFPDAFNYQSSDRLMTINARLMTGDQVAANTPDSSLLAVSGASVLMHESLLNNAIDQMGLAGQTLTEPELRVKLESFLTVALNRPFKFEAPTPTEPAAADDEKGPSAIIFAATDPIRIRIADGELTIVIRAGFKQEGKEDIPMREVRVPISFEVQGQKIAAKRGNVIVSAAEGQGGGISINAVVRKKIQADLPDRLVDGKVDFKTPEKELVAYVTKITLVDGWVAISID